MNRLALILVVAFFASNVECIPEASDLQVTGRGIADMAKNMWSYFFGDGNEYDYADYVDYAASDDVSSYTFYNPNSPRRESYDVTDGEDEYSWGEMALGAVGLIVPALLIFSAFNPFPANLFTIAVKKRSFDSAPNTLNLPEIEILKIIQSTDVLNVFKPSCQKKMFCEVSQLGKEDNATFLQRAFYYVSHLTPDNLAKRMYLHKVFEASRQNHCAVFSCSSPLTLHEGPSNHIEVPSKAE